MQYIERTDGITYYEIYGEGLPIIFIHPPGMGKITFEYQKRLANRFKIILPDLSGHGDSTPSRNHTSIIKQFVDELSMIIDNEQLDEAIICGYSAGGMIAQEFAFTYPNKTKAILLSGGYPKVATNGLKVEYKLGMSLLKASPESLANVLAFSHAKRTVYRKALFEHICKSDVSNWLEFYEETLYYDCVQKLQSVKSPLLTVYGQQAFWINKHKKYYHSCPDAEIAIVRNSLHQVPTKKWQAFNHVINNFIQSKFVNEM
ncbi:alpha/beta fold hydrolase [Aquibacillus albus]|uniref:Pimeloyl-ACP methyl ester carboxylesterase n=1 Tax=Aquibacillus albus TaxID=1168171 RepID=A0ABS2MVJ2_9BACI|nr:alpha/beta hydrolase [Aquibacillus albus]MBM7569900.1 pimeloyl-ACP methyl ester carboxylesterase [Aquibacillus albus]